MNSLAEARFVQRRGVQSRVIDDGAVLVDISSGKIFELNRLGAEIWTMLGSGADFGRICDALSERYKVERAALEADVNGLVESLLKAGLVESALLNKAGVR